MPNGRHKCRITGKCRVIGKARIVGESHVLGHRLEETARVVGDGLRELGVDQMLRWGSHLSRGRGGVGGRGNGKAGLG